MEKEKYLDFLNKGYMYSTEQFDKAILYVSSGTLGISITMIDKVVQIEIADYKWMLFIAWILETAAILLFTINHLVSVRSFSNEIKSEKEIIEQTCEFQENISINQQEKPSENLNKWVKYINHLSIVALVSGILFLLIFIILNI